MTDEQVRAELERIRAALGEIDKKISSIIPIQDALHRDCFVQALRDIRNIARKHWKGGKS
jgi:hypothetical protein